MGKLEEDLYVVQVKVRQIQSQLDQVLQLLQNNVASSILRITEPNLKREEKEHTKAITLRFGTMIKETIQPNYGEKAVGEKDRPIPPPPPPPPPPSSKLVPFLSSLRGGEE
ncbi:hypothetical protein PVK06_007432 [Gossypium arboreum]|uniref:Uncharacterized protein n=1 Tax=Gossypium arboreum TaxID=29729 RepID=A0ABR0QI88_GOSAR|nr:hypothetical protein PVK06_007432 [Gossypium arboreum]